MDFDLNEEQRAYRAEVARFAQKELNDDVCRRDHQGAFPHEAWKACAAFGIHGLAVPAEFGGSEAGPLTMMAAMEGLGYGCRDNGLIFAINAQMWSCQYPIARFGTNAQKRLFLPGLCDGSVIAAHAMSEPGSGSDAFSLATTAVRDGEDYILNGSKMFVTNAPIADLFVVFVTTDASRRLPGLCAFLVERGTPGLTSAGAQSKMGLRTAQMGEVRFEDCRVSATSMLGRPGAGMAIFTAAMEQERSFILASAVGTMERNLERCIHHARSRRQFSQPIGKFQAVSHKVVDLKVRLDTARLLLHRLGWLMEEGRPAALDAALTKLYVSESFVQSGLDALQIHGGYGYLSEHEVERDVRDAIGSRIYSGTSEIQRNLVARHLGL